MEGPALKRWRDAAGLSQTALAEWLDVAPNTIARWERGKIAIPAFLPLALAEVKRRINERPEKNVLQDYLLRRLKELGLSFNAISERAKKRNHELSPYFVKSVAQGRITNPSVKNLQALAAGLDQPPAELFALFESKARQRS